VGRGSAADIAAQQQRVPGNPEDALFQRLQNIIAGTRRAQKSALDAVEDVRQQLRIYYDTVLSVDLILAKNDCEKAKTVMPRALSWSRTAQLLGFGDEFAAEIQEIMDTFVAALVNCYNEAFDKCVNNNDPTQVNMLLSFLRQLSLLGADDQVDQGKIERCARFELKFESIMQTAPDGHLHEARATKVPVRLDGPVGGTLTGSGPLEDKVTYIGPSLSPCSQTSNGGSSAFEVVRLFIDINVFEGGPPPEPMKMLYAPGQPDFTFRLTCPPTPGGPTIDQTFNGPTWFGIYGFNHLPEFISADQILAEGWERGSGSLYARKTYTKGAEFKENTTMELKHTPQK
jgi:hypothetical protein